MCSQLACTHRGDIVLGEVEADGALLHPVPAELESPLAGRGGGQQGEGLVIALGVLLRVRCGW
jgi:hypothetical protein